jgi:hypothetical protein
MQRLAVQCRELPAERLGQTRDLGLESLAIKGIADDGRPDMGEVDAHLMSASGLQPAFEERGNRSAVALGGTERGDHSVVCDGSAALVRKHRHLSAARRMATDGGLDGAAGTRRRGPDKGEVGALQAARAAMIGKFGGEAAMGLIGLGHHQEPARVLVEAVDDARPRHPADAR